jgi:hypothetical protein
LASLSSNKTLSLHHPGASAQSNPSPSPSKPSSKTTERAASSPLASSKPKPIVFAITDNGAYLHLNHYGYSTIAVTPHSDEEGEVVKKENLANKPAVKKPAAKKSGTKKPDEVMPVVKRQCKSPKVGIPLAKRAYNWKNAADMRPKSVKHRESLGIAATPKEEIWKATPGKAKVAGRK